MRSKQRSCRCPEQVKHSLSGIENLGRASKKRETPRAGHRVGLQQVNATSECHESFGALLEAVWTCADAADNLPHWLSLHGNDVIGSFLSAAHTSIGTHLP
jgi:hypothetical protein